MADSSHRGRANLLPNKALQQTARRDFTWIGPLAGLALLAVGVFTQIVYWDVVPLWYHLASIAFIVPVAMAGANLITRRRKTVEIS